MNALNNPYSSVTLKEAAQIIAAIGENITCLVSGEVGIGKSSMLKELVSMPKFKDHEAIYIEAAGMDVGDGQMPKFEQCPDGKWVVTFAPNKSFGLHLDRPVLIMFDELGKAAKSVINMLSRILLEHQMGEHSLYPGSVVFATTNLTIEGLGDNIPAHSRNRVCQLKVRKPTAMEWVENYAIPNKLHPVVIGTAMEFPTMFQSFEELEDASQNHYIYNPKAPKAAFVTPRSLDKASYILRQTEEVHVTVRTHTLMGMIGEAAAMDLMTLARLADDLPAWKQILAHPETAKVPTSGAACGMLVAKAVMNVERETFDAWMQYLERLPKELQALFARTIMSGEKKQMAARHKKFVAWAVANMYMYA